MTALRSGSATDVGRRRQNNQDMILEAETIFAVADGMGGYLGGEVASLAAIEALRQGFRRDPTADGFEEAIRLANEAVSEQANANAELRNMGTTLTAIALVEDDGSDLLAIANIGDSRAYLLRDGELSQLTQDHSVPEELMRQGQLTASEAAADPRRHILTRVLGASFGEGPDVQKLVPFTGDRLLVCSDGLYNEVDERDLAKALRTIKDPNEAAQRLVEQANFNGGGDNISVIVIDVVDDDGRAVSASETLAEDPAPAARASEPRTPPRRGASGLMSADERNAELRRLTRDADSGGRAESTWGTGDAEPAEHQLPARRVTGRLIAFLVVLVLVLGGAAAAVGIYARGAYFVGIDEGRVAIFKGRPGGLLWFAPTIEERSDLTEAAVPPERADDVASGYEVATLEEARNYVRNLEPTTTTTTAAPVDTTAPAAETETTAAP